MQKFYWNNQQPSYTQTDNCKPFKNISSRDPRLPSSQIYSDLSQLTLNINNNPTVTGPYKNGTTQTNIKQDQVFCVQVKNEAQQRGKNQCRNISAGNKVVLQLGDITVDNSHMITNEAVTRSMAPDARIYNRDRAARVGIFIQYLRLFDLTRDVKVIFKSGKNDLKPNKDGVVFHLKAVTLQN